MAKLYGCDKNTILSFAKEIGYVNPKTHGKLTEEDKLYIINHYEDMTSNELALNFGVARGQITKLWYDHGLRGKDIREYPFNDSYFKIIDSKDKAYFLGWLASDGNVYKRKDSENCQAFISLSLNQKDEQILETFKKYIDCEKPLSICERICDNYISYSSSLQLVSDEMFNDLSQYGIIPKKTYNFDMPNNLDEKLYSHYLRGYFDGDGCIKVDHKKYKAPSSYSVSYSGFTHNLELMKNKLLENNIKSSILLDKRKTYENIEFGSLNINSIENVYNFYKYLYNDCDDLYLSRKKYLFDCFLTAIKNNYSNRQNIYNRFLNNAVLNETVN